MRCPKCSYIAFEGGDRCPNCGYEFALAVAPDDLDDLPLREDDDRYGPPEDLALGGTRTPPAPTPPAARQGRHAGGSPDLPLFDASGDPGRDDAGFVAVAATPHGARGRVRAEAGHDGRRREAAAPEVHGTSARERAAAATPREVRPRDRAGVDRWAGAAAAAARHDEADAAPLLRRVVALVLDLTMLGAIDATVVYFTLRVTGLASEQLGRLPVLPMLGFLALLNGGYVVGFTVASGQTIGKMVAGLRVVTEDGGRVPLGTAIVRAAAYVVSVLPLGIGCLPALLGAGGRTLHDRLAATRVVAS